MTFNIGASEQSAPAGAQAERGAHTSHTLRAISSTPPLNCFELIVLSFSWPEVPPYKCAQLMISQSLRRVQAWQYRPRQRQPAQLPTRVQATPAYPERLWASIHRGTHRWGLFMKIVEELAILYYDYWCTTLRYTKMKSPHDENETTTNGIPTRPR